MSGAISEKMPAAFEVGLQGWDTANVVDKEIINQSIIKQDTSPHKFHAKDEFLGNTLKGKWGPWQIIADAKIGSKYIAFECPVKSGSYVNSEGEGALLDGATVYMHVELSAIPDPEAEKGDKTASRDSSGQIMKLIPAGAVPKDQKKDAKKVQPITVQNIVVKDGMSAEDLADAKELFVEWFEANLDAFNHIFHIAILSEIADKGDFQWLKPTQLSYAGISNNQGDAVFAALCETDGDTPRRQVQQVDGEIMRDWPEGANSVIAISGEKFTEKVLFAGAQQVMKGSTPDDFDITGNGLVVTNNKELKWQDLTLENEEIISPMVPKGGFTMKVHQDCIRMEFSGVTFKMKLMIGHDIAMMNFTQDYGIKMGRNSDGNAVLMATNNVPSQTPPESWDDLKDLPNVSDVNFTVRPDETAVEAARIMQIVTIAAMIVGAGFMVDGVFVANTDSLAAEIKEAGIATKVLEAGKEFDQALNVGRDAFEAGHMEGNLAAAAAITSEAVPAARYGMFLGSLQITASLAVLAGPIMSTIEKWQELGDQKITEDHVPTLDNFMDNVLGVAEWPDTKGWELIDVRLAGSLLLYGKLSSDAD